MDRFLMVSILQGIGSVSVVKSAVCAGSKRVMVYENMNRPEIVYKRAG